MIIHHLDQAKAALDAADACGVSIQLKSDAAASAGTGYLRTIEQAIGREILIDCGDDPGLVMAALRAGCRKLVFQGPNDVRQRLCEIAAQQDADVFEPEHRSAPCLTLAPEDDGAVVGAWLRSLSKG